MKMLSLRHALLVLSPMATLAMADTASAQGGPIPPFLQNDRCETWPNGPKPRPKFSAITKSADGNTTYAQTGLFLDSVKVDPTPVPGHDVATEGGALYPFFNFDLESDDPKNLLPTVYENIRTCEGNEMINTLASTPERPYNLHLEDPVNGDPDPDPINATSPTDDLDALRRLLNAGIGTTKKPKKKDLRRGMDILEGEPIADRVYSGFPMLHYNGPLKVKKVDAATRTVTVNQIWFDNHIESDTGYIDPSAVEKLPNGEWDDGEWYIKYNVMVLNRGHEDFAPFPMLYDDPKEIRTQPDANGVTGPMFIPNVSIDQTFFPMEEGLRYSFTIKQTPARFYNLTYHWGWRIHPPRIQATENLLRGFTINGVEEKRDIFERIVFGDPADLGSNSTSKREEAKLAAISMIGDLAPAKRMWSALRALEDARSRGDYSNYPALAAEYEESFFDWKDRTKLPRGVDQDPDADVTLVYMNNTIYGNLKGRVRDAQVRLTKWKKRGDKIHVTLKNADYYPHQYTLVDFGGMRGWENQFHNTLPIGGAGPWFTFGRIHWWPHTVQPPAAAGGQPQIVVGPAARPTNAASIAFGLEDFKRVDKGEKFLPKKGDKGSKNNVFGHDQPEALLGTAEVPGTLGRHDVEWTFNYEPSQRLRMYQFDAFHHDVAIWSIH